MSAAPRLSTSLTSLTWRCAVSNTGNVCDTNKNSNHSRGMPHWRAMDTSALRRPFIFQGDHSENDLSSVHTTRSVTHTFHIQTGQEMLILFLHNMACTWGSIGRMLSGRRRQSVGPKMAQHAVNVATRQMILNHVMGGMYNGILPLKDNVRILARRQGQRGQGNLKTARRER